MARFKQIMYLSAVMVVFIIFSNYMIKVGINNTYKTILGEVKIESPEIVVTEAKTTEVNGYVKGTIKNNRGTDIEKIYIKLDLYTKRNNNLGDEYIEISNLKAEETRAFEIKFNYNDVDNFKITCVNSK